MSDWTLLNLKDEVENVAERVGLAPDLEARFCRKPVGLEGGDTEMLGGFRDESPAG